MVTDSQRTPSILHLENQCPCIFEHSSWCRSCIHNPELLERHFISPEQSQWVVFKAIVPLPTPGVIYLWPNTTWLDICTIMTLLAMYLKVPQKSAATKTPGIPWNLPSTSITKYGKICTEINMIIVHMSDYIKLLGIPLKRFLLKKTMSIPFKGVSGSHLWEVISCTCRISSRDCKPLSWDYCVKHNVYISPFHMSLSRLIPVLPVISTMK